MDETQISETFVCTARAGRTVGVAECTLSWTPRRPLLVKAAFLEGREGDESAVVWHFGRGLLRDALASKEVQGVGDVKLQVHGASQRLKICLSTAEGHADILAPLGPVTRFLARTQSVMAVDGPEEGRAIDLELDALIQDLMEPEEEES